ncbi:MAG TPA: S53 family peptidase [Ktedonobacterales bacterium]|nr:S53 family peptidase [Ktedonobacterales bacterium]
MRTANGARRVRKRIGLAVSAVLVLVTAISLVASGSLGRPQSPAHTSTAHPATTTRLGPADGSRTIDVSLVLRGQSQTDFTATLAAVSNPSSPRYRHYLTPAQYASQFGPTTQDRARAATMLRDAGLTVTQDAGTLISARGTVRQVEALFQVSIDDYRASDGDLYYAAAGPARIPPALSGIVSGVLGLENRHIFHRGVAMAPSSPFQPGTAGYTPTDLRDAYSIAPLLSAGLDGTNITVALAEIDAFHPNDVTTYDSAYGISAPAVRVVKVSGGSRSTSPEPVLDIEVLHAIAPRASLIAYESPGDLGSIAQMFSQMVSDGKAQILSISLGACEAGLTQSDANSFLNSLDSTFQQAGAQGMSVLVASGDSGAYGCQNNQLSVSLPASSPYVTAVGGTALFLNGDDSYGREAGWEGPLEGAGTGGGLSVYYQRPSWQTGSGVDNSFSNGMRQVPDISADADPLTGYSIYFSDGRCSGGDCWTVVGGTSAAAPLWAGIVALADQAGAASGKRLGFLNPALYRLGSTANSGAAAPFHDVTMGGNLYYPATPGWDFSTGWGTPDAGTLVHDLLSLT